MRLTDWFRSMTNLWVIASAIFLAVALMGIIAFILWYSRPVAETPGSVTAVLNVLPAPTSTPLPATPTSPPPATSTLPAPPEGVIALGGTVQISGTGGDGLRLRQAPGLEQPMRLLGAEDEIFTVTDGPQESDGYVWWYIEGLYDATRSGWAVANYLEGNQGP